MSWELPTADSEPAQWQSGDDSTFADADQAGGFNVFDASNTSKHDTGTSNGCYNCGQDGHNKAECPNPAVERPFDGTCNNCGAEGHRAVSCPEPRKGRVIAIYGPEVKEADPADAWERLMTASANKDLDDFRIAIQEYTKATPEATFSDLETGLREADGKIYLVAIEQAIADTHTIIDLQGKIDQKYVVSYQFEIKPRRLKFAAGWPSSEEENMERLNEAGWIRDRGIPKCNNCDELGHTRKYCTQESVEREKTDEIFCNNCKQPGHRLRDCPKPRPDPNLCRNCKQPGHRASDCDQPRDMSDVECKYCKEMGHMALDCPSKSATASRGCRNCGEDGHIARDCPQPPDPTKMQCRNCDAMGHASRECPKPRDYSRVKCAYCEQMGHTPVRCEKKKADEAAGGAGAEDMDAAAGSGWAADGAGQSTGGW